MIGVFGVLVGGFLIVVGITAAFVAGCVMLVLIVKCATPKGREWLRHETRRRKSVDEIKRDLARQEKRAQRRR